VVGTCQRPITGPLGARSQRRGGGGGGGGVHKHRFASVARTRVSPVPRSSRACAARLGNAGGWGRPMPSTGWAAAKRMQKSREGATEVMTERRGRDRAARGGSVVGSAAKREAALWGRWQEARRRSQSGYRMYT